MYVPDNYDMFLAHEAEQARMLEKLPICDECGEYIQDEFYYVFDYKEICQDCLDNGHKKYVEV